VLIQKLTLLKQKITAKSVQIDFHCFWGVATGLPPQKQFVLNKGFWQLT
jgi:hypothetical protein